MAKDLQEINRIERLTQQYFNKGEIHLGLKTYRMLMEMYPLEKDYYLNYIGFLRDELVVAELLWPAYEEAVACCNRAIAQLPEEDRVLFYIKKSEVYIVMIEGNPDWYTEHHEDVKNFINISLEKYPGNGAIIKCAMALSLMAGDRVRYEELLDQGVSLNPDDLMLVLQKAVSFEQQGNFENAIDLLENWIRRNPSSKNIDTVYNKIILLCEEADKDELADAYRDLLDNL